ncbi:hypothetical protein AB4Z25_24845 [Rhizobium sp. RAF36]|uniref:hypothetical protein n=1 Tax=Rhizobium sp. RAF36 TaxID=3233055 RepID=UPI003F9B4648
MPKRRPKPDNDGGPTLRDIRIPQIEVECSICDRRQSYERKALVEKFGTGASFALLRRRMAMGCERMNTPKGDRCETRFPCLGP